MSIVVDEVFVWVALIGSALCSLTAIGTLIAAWVRKSSLIAGRALNWVMVAFILSLISLIGGRQL